MIVLCIADIHEPAARVGYLEHCQAVQAKYNCNKVVFIGDIVDWHAISFHTRHPDLPGPKDEFELAKVGVKRWYKTFPEAQVVASNHGDRPARLAASVGIPRILLKPDAELWGTPGWEYLPSTVIDRVKYIHGEGCGGQNPAFTRAKATGMSTVCGHHHKKAGIDYFANDNALMFGMTLGAGCNDHHPAMEYAKNSTLKSIVTCGVVVDGIPYLEPMKLVKRTTVIRVPKADKEITGKVCSKCNQHKYWINFHRDCTALDGHKSQCKECRNGQS